MLQEIVDSARALTRARYGIIVTIDETGAVRELVTSGLTAEDKRQFEEWPEGPRLFKQVCRRRGPLRPEDLPDYVHESDSTPALMRSRTVHSMPMRHRGEQVGTFFLSEKADGEAFGPDDEELLVLFAAQAAAAIVNARIYRDEHRARADLEALVETSPVGVAVSDADTGRPASVNREAMRMFAPLLDPDVDLPVIVISRYGRDETIARAFESGAADYIVKPFSPTELVARVGAALRGRIGTGQFVHGQLAIDYAHRRVTVGGRAVALTPIEYEVLRILSVNVGSVVTSASLLRQVWGTRSAADTEPVRAFVKKLRDKLGDSAAGPTWIVTERGVGYRMPAPEEE